MIDNDEYLKAKKALKKVQETYFYSKEFIDFIYNIRFGIDKIYGPCIKIELRSELPQHLIICDSYAGIKILQILCQKD